MSADTALTAQSMESVQFEILEMNSYGMHLCQSKNLPEAQECLETAYMRLQALADAIALASTRGPSANDEDAQSPTAEQLQMLDQLKATTLNNLGVVECHRSEHSRALDHLEAAQLLELRNGIQSPSTCLNLCAVYNAVSNYERASQLALEAISMLNASGEALTDDTKSLWGAAWHNLGVAELNNGRPNKNADVVAIFRHAMAATKDLLGPKHPMTIAVHETYRRIRDRLKEEGAFKERVPATLPRLRKSAEADTQASPQAHAESLHGATFTHGNGPLRARPQPSRFLGMNSYHKKPSTATTASLAHLHPTVRSTGSHRLYNTRHPLIQKLQGPLPSLSRGSMKTASPPGTARTELAIAPPPQPAYAPQPPSAPRDAPNTARAPPKRRLSELLLGDMWVEVQVPRYTSPPVAATGNSPQRSPMRPGYGEALYVIDPADAVVEGINEPSAYARLDVAQPAEPTTTEPPKATAPSHAAPPPKQSATPVQKPQSPERISAAREISAALGDSLPAYPSLQALVDANALLAGKSPTPNQGAATTSNGVATQ